MKYEILKSLLISRKCNILLRYKLNFSDTETVPRLDFINLTVFHIYKFSMEKFIEDRYKFGDYTTS